MGIFNALNRNSDGPEACFKAEPEHGNTDLPEGYEASKGKGRLGKQNKIKEQTKQTTQHKTP